MTYLAHTKSLLQVDVTEPVTDADGTTYEETFGQIRVLAHYCVYLDDDATLVTDRQRDGITIKIKRDYDEDEDLEIRLNEAEIVALRTALSPSMDEVR